jgi:hypothetical protein
MLSLNNSVLKSTGRWKELEEFSDIVVPGKAARSTYLEFIRNSDRSSKKWIVFFPYQNQWHENP